jgi:uracil-DNA glycosylase family 4
MEGKRRVLSSCNGRVGAKVMFVGEAPGRNGADRTGIPFHGDPSGNLFERLLEGVGWRREEVFVTNAVLCNPRDEKGANRAPSMEESGNCSVHLESQVRYVDPLVVVTMGGSALKALSIIEPHELILTAVVATPRRWFGRWVFPLYHPSPRALIHRNMATQAEDFRKLKDFVGGLTDAQSG